VYGEKISTFWKNLNKHCQFCTRLLLTLPTSSTQALCKCLLSKNVCNWSDWEVCKFLCSCNPIVCTRSLHSTVLHDTPWSVFVTSKMNVRLMYPLLTHLGPSENTLNHPWDWPGFWSCMQYEYWSVFLFLETAYPLCWAT